jgi:DNA-binding response OmpR family regulator
MIRARILVADDDPDLLETLGDALERTGAEVVRAASGADLIECIADYGPFSLIITDVSMPWMSGLQAMHSARTAGIDTPIIVMTGLDDARIRSRVVALGGDAAFLLKPFELAELTAVVMGLLAEERAS